MPDNKEKSKLIASYLESLSGSSAESLLSSISDDNKALEGIGNRELNKTRSAMEKVFVGKEVDEEEMYGLEKVIHLDIRPSRLIQDGRFDTFEGEFRYLSENDDVKENIRKAIKAVGRIDIPKRDARDRYAGSGFVVGRNLVITNRHVAEIFTSGVGQQGVSIKPWITSEFDTKHEFDRPDVPGFRLKKCLMVHPYWDMALFEADLPPGISTLKFAVDPVADLYNREIVVIGFPAFNQFTSQQVREIFNATDRVKQLAPGKISKRKRKIGSEWLNSSVEAMAHDASTMPGNSGSVVLDVATGTVLGLHFAGRYLIENYAVPGIELGKDKRVVDAGVQFDDPLPPPSNALNSFWKNADPSGGTGESARSRIGQGSAKVPSVVGHQSGNEVSFEVPVRISVSIPGFSGIGGSFASMAGGYFGTSSTETTVDSYEGTAGAIDVGFWNIEWFSNRYNQKVNRVAELVDELKLDIWCFQEASPNATAALVERLNDHHGGSYDYLSAEPNASDGKQSNTIIWNTENLSCEKESWGDLEHLFQLDSRDPMVDEIMNGTEAVHGKVFNRYPQIFKCVTNDGYDFRIVPLHLKARSEGSLRRRIASAILAHAVNQKIEEGVDDDWIIGGDMNATLQSEDFDKLTGGGFDAISADDEQNGGFTYIKRPYKSLIDHIFLSPNLSNITDSDDFFIVARDLQDPRDFLRNLSDHRPIILRMSIAAEESLQTKLAGVFG